jgi:hypothetical protein
MINGGPMKKSGMILLLLLSLAWAPASAQERGAADPTPSPIQKQKKAIMAQNMMLTEKEGQVFWPLYDEYQAELNQLGDRTAGWIMNYTKDYDSLSDEKAKDAFDEFLRLDEQRLRLKKVYLEKFRRALSERKVMRYFQLENKLEAIMNLELINTIPLMK